MTPNNNISVLPFYSSLAKQNNKKDYALGSKFYLHYPTYILPPFQIIRGYNADNLTHVKIINSETGESTTITTDVVTGGLTIHGFENTYSIVKYPYGHTITGLTKGRYYLEILIGTTEYWYSDEFIFVDNITEYLKIQYYDKDDLILPYGRIEYANSFRWVLFLPTQLSRPSYEFEEEVTKKDGYYFPESQISQKVYSFKFLASEYLLDAMRIIRLSDAVFVLNKGEAYYVDRFLMTPKWEDGGFLASVEAEFQCDTVIKKIGKMFTASEIGDFNNDFNNDFNT